MDVFVHFSDSLLTVRRDQRSESGAPQNVSISTVASESAAGKKEDKETRRMDKTPQFLTVPLFKRARLKVEAGGADGDNDILQKVTTCGFSFDRSATSVSFQRDSQHALWRERPGADLYIRGSATTSR